MNNIEILEEWIKIDRKMRNNSTESDYDKFCEEKCIAIENLIKENTQLRIQISARETVVEELEKENKELKEDKEQQEFEIKTLKSDIKNMYDTEAVLSILENELDLSRNEAIDVLESY